MRNLKFILTISLIWAGICLADSQRFAEINEPLKDVDEIVNKANIASYYQGSDGKAKVKMTITDIRGLERNREFIILRKNTEQGGDQKYFVYFQRPADVRGMVFMVHKYVDDDKDDDRWLYMPGLDLVRRIASGDKRTSFVGSDYLYEDVSGRSLTEDTHELIETTDKYYLVKNTPKNPDNVEFSYYNVYIDRENFMPYKMEYFKTAGGEEKLYRSIEAKEIEEIDGYPTVVKSLVKNIETESETFMEFSDISYDIDLKDIFTERYLRRPPREATR